MRVGLLRGDHPYQVMLALQANGLSMSILGSIADPRKWQEWIACFALQTMCEVWFSLGCFYQVYP